VLAVLLLTATSGQAVCPAECSGPKTPNQSKSPTSSDGAVPCFCQGTYPVCRGQEGVLCNSCCENQAQGDAGSSVSNSIRAKGTSQADRAIDCSGCSSPTKKVGCISIDSQVFGENITTVIKDMNWQLRHHERIVVSEVLCINQAVYKLCLTANHIVVDRKTGKTMTLRMYCEAGVGKCVRTEKRVINFFTPNPKDTICTEDLCITQFVDGVQWHFISRVSRNSYLAKTMWRMLRPLNFY
jgi:hypothetical protein